MKSTVLFLLLIVFTLNADDCKKLKASFEKEEKAYDITARIAIAGNSAYKIIGRFINVADKLLTQCPKSYSLDRQYTLKRKIAKARQFKESYRVFTQGQVARYARSHPEEIIVYKWGTIRQVR
jgi:hypothetical protein